MRRIVPFAVLGSLLTTQVAMKLPCLSAGTAARYEELVSKVRVEREKVAATSQVKPPEARRYTTIKQVEVVNVDGTVSVREVEEPTDLLTQILAATNPAPEEILADAVARTRELASRVRLHFSAPLREGVEPAYMGIGPVPATQKVLQRTGLKIDDMDVIEANEAFAAQACAVIQQLGLDPAKVNPNGSGISLGHPVGATGAIITTKAIAELQRTGGRYALVTMCIGGGQGIAAIFERV